MKIIVWHNANQAPDNQDNWNKIQSWWNGLDGSNIEFIQISGSQKDSSTGKEEILWKRTQYLTITNPCLENNYITFIGNNGRIQIQVDKFELDINKNELKVYFSNSLKYIFIHNRGQAFFRIEYING